MAILLLLAAGVVAAGVATLPPVYREVPTECVIDKELRRINWAARPAHRMQEGEIAALALQTRISCERWNVPWQLFLAIVNNESCGAWEEHDHDSKGNARGWGWVALQQHEAEDSRVLRKLGLDAPDYVKGSNWGRCRRDTRHYVNVAVCWFRVSLEIHDGDIWKMLLVYNKGPRGAVPYLKAVPPQEWPYVWVGSQKNPKWCVATHYLAITGFDLPRWNVGGPNLVGRLTGDRLAVLPNQGPSSFGPPSEGGQDR